MTAPDPLHDFALTREFTLLLSNPQTPLADKLHSLLRKLGFGDSNTDRLDVLASNLKPVLEDAERDGLNLLHPHPAGETFHEWVTRSLNRKLRGDDPVNANTFNARATTLSRVYTRLVERGVIDANPLEGLPRLTRLEADATLPSRAQLGVLHRQAQASDPPLHAALLLIDEHACTVTELLRLTWQDFDLPQGTFLRAPATARLGPELGLALGKMQRPAGGALHARGVVLRDLDDDQPFTERILRYRLYTASKHAGVPYHPPSELRLAGLRDHAQEATYQHARQRGYLNKNSYRKATARAQALAAKLSLQDDESARERATTDG